MKSYKRKEEKMHTREVAEIVEGVRREGADFRDGNDSSKQISSSYNWERAEIVRRVSERYPDRVRLLQGCAACRRGQRHSGCSDLYEIEGVEYAVYSGMLG